MKNKKLQKALDDFRNLGLKGPRYKMRGHGNYRLDWSLGSRRAGSFSLFLWERIVPEHKTVLTYCQGQSLESRSGDSNIVVSPEAHAIVETLQELVDANPKSPFSRGSEKLIRDNLSDMPVYKDSRYGWRYAPSLAV